ncbi:hypothetical protein ACH5RR_023521 [Cinchona calisaya]|uniref:Bifunctional inhibitor/plant lipid transfer protein/seed storage helical domain-containing protein n=1 Tax=Cinchona calisaya TaxID=153742 RepID=A0ABD2ZC04_9GENT
MKSHKGKLSLIQLAFLLLMFQLAISDDAQDKQECTNSLIGLATCLPYVEGNAKAPTPDCCTGLKQVLKSSKKCLCLVIKDRNDPDLGLTINLTLALGLPSVCNAPANISQCPALLHLDPNSPDAQVFYQNGHAPSSIAGSPANSPTATVGASSSEGNSAPGSNAQHESDGDRIGISWLRVETVAILFLLSLTANLLL